MDGCTTLLSFLLSLPTESIDGILTDASYFKTWDQNVFEHYQICTLDRRHLIAALWCQEKVFAGNLWVKSTIDNVHILQDSIYHRRQTDICKITLMSWFYIFAIIKNWRNLDECILFWNLLTERLLRMFAPRIEEVSLQLSVTNKKSWRKIHELRVK